MTKRDHAGVFVPPPLLFLLPLAAAWLLESQWPLPIDLGSDAVRLVVAVICVAAGISLGLASVAAFRRQKTTILPAGRPTTVIVDAGPYRFSRNPMYVAMALAYVGLSVVLASWWAIGLLPAAVLIVDVFVIRREETYLAGKFGRPYLDYMTRVRRWL